MRILKLNLIAVALLLFGATSANAFAINMVARNSTVSLDVSDTVTVDVFFDATATGIILFSSAVLSSNSSVMSYDPVASAALPDVYGVPTYSTGSRPDYILYDAGMSVGMTVTPLVQLLAQQSPAWLTWPAPPVGQQQVNINFAEANITDTFNTRTTGNGIWIASMVFHIDQAFTTEELALSVTSGGNILQVGLSIIAPGTIGLSAPIVLTGVVPEPTTAILMGLGLLGLVISGRRKS